MRVSTRDSKVDLQLDLLFDQIKELMRFGHLSCLFANPVKDLTERRMPSKIF